jgi:hypothetical protein
MGFILSRRLQTISLRSSPAVVVDQPLAICVKLVGSQKGKMLRKIEVGTLLVLGGLAASALRAQTTQISGQVTDQSKGAVAAARITLTRTETGETKGTLSTDQVHGVSQFAKPLSRDMRAVELAIETPWSNGPLEGQINRLKAIKRQMYGRAGFQLLRARVLPWHGSIAS